MTPAEFIAKWRASPKREHIDSQPHFLDLCRLLGIDDPATADPAHDWFTFEKGATKSTGGQGWADVWRKGCFGWEYKSFGRPLDPAFDQLLRYAGALENPPLLIVSDMDRILVRTNWTNTVQETHTLALDDLLDATKRDLLRAAFTDPERLKPKKTRDALTAEAAAALLHPRPAPARARPRPRDRRPLRQPPRLLHVRRGRGPPPRQPLPADAGSLPPRARRLRRPRRHPLRRDAGRRPRRLHPGRLVQRRPLRRRHRPPRRPHRHRPAPRGRPPRLVPDRPLDPRHPLRARPRPRQAQPARRPLHRPRQDHEDRQPGHRRPAPRRMGRGPQPRSRPPSPARSPPPPPPPPPAPTTRPLELRTAFLERLKAFRVLDPACGSGNFLYLALRALKDIEHRVNVECEALGLPRSFPAGRPRGRPRHRAQPLRRRARPRLGLDRRDPVDARQRLRRLAATPSSAPSTPSNAATPS